VRPGQQEGLTGFILAGHSFGGYIAGLYACRYHKHIKKLLMLSPAGITTHPDDHDHYEYIASRIKKQKRWVPSRRQFNCCQSCFARIWKCKCSPFGIMRYCGRCCVKQLMKNYVKRRFASVPESELVDYKNYLH
jgi:pimeloyl-ACP methyl ester carboxylesterase